jgi:lycopene cyclase domain-containing protein
MSYFGFLACFLLIPILILALLQLATRQRVRALPLALQGASATKVVALLVVVALLYTTPWDNYLVATGVWWYNPELVAGIILGWVPLEEYLFFVLQPILVGLWLLWLARRLPVGASLAAKDEWSQVRPFSPLFIVSFATLCLWIMSVVFLMTDWQPGRYLALELAWALPPILLQLFFGADILRRHWRLLLLTIVPITLYLSLADALAIMAGIWTIDPAQSTGILLGGKLPFEEFVFFLLTTLLVTLGVVLGIAEESWQRIAAARATFSAVASNVVRQFH